MADMALRGDFKLDKLIDRRFWIEGINNDVAEAIKKRQVVGRRVGAWD